MLLFRRNLLVRQSTATDCGAAALAMLLRRLGVHAEYAAVRETTGWSRDGLSAHALVSAGGRLGVPLRGVAVGTTDIRAIPAPAILHWEDSHFVVLNRWRLGAAEVLDPLLGCRLLRDADLRRSFSGTAIIPSVDGNPLRVARVAPRRSKRGTAGQSPKDSPVGGHAEVLVDFVWECLCLVPVLVVACVLALYEHGGSDARFTGDLGMSMAASVVMVLVAAAMLTRASARERIVARRTRGRLRAWGELVSAVPLTMLAQRKWKDFVGSTTTVGEIVRGRRALAAGAAEVTVSGLGLAVLVWPSLPLLILGVGDLLLLLLGRRTATLRTQAVAQFRASKSRGLLKLAVTNAWTRRLSAGDQALVERWRMLIDAEGSLLADHRMGHAVVAGLTASTELLCMLALVLSLRVAVRGAHYGWETALIACAAAQWHLMALRRLISATAGVSHLEAHVSHIREISESLPTSKYEAAPTRRWDGSPGLSLRLRDIHFRYDADSSWLLSGIDLTIPAGQVVGIVGGPGSGKSTLAHVALGLLEASSGAVIVDGEQVSGARRHALLVSGVVPNVEIEAIDGTVAENVRLGVPDLEDSAMIAACEAVGLRAFIESLPLGYQTPVRDNGRNFSSSERMLLLLARAVASGAPVLVLDSICVRFDPLTSERVWSGIRSLGRTVLFVTNDPAELRFADQRYLLTGGRVTGTGA